MSLLLKIENDFKRSLKHSDRIRLSVLRMVKAEAKNREIEKGKPLDDHDVIDVLSKYVKQRRESIEQFTLGGRTEMADQEKAELEILLEYLPRQLSDEELEQEISQAVQQSGARGLEDMGNVMKILMPRVKGLADGRKISEMVKGVLGSS